MFSNLGLFSNVPCPDLENCSLLRCFFSHEDPKQPEKPPSPAPVITGTKRKLDDTVAAAALPCAKQKRPAKEHRKTSDSTSNTASNGSASTLNAHRSRKVDEALTRPITPPIAKRAKPNPRNADTAISHTINPPARATQKAVQPKSNPAPTKAETLTPRTVPVPPEKFDLRFKFLKKLHTFAVDYNKLATHTSDGRRIPDLTEQELVSYAVEEEYQLALQGSSYKQKLGHLMARLSKKQPPHPVQWKLLLLQNLADKERAIKAGDIPPLRFEYPPSDLGISRKQEFSLVKHFRHEQHLLRRAEYVVAAPTSEEIERFETGQRSAKGLEVCDRCKTRFKVFEGRREGDGVLASGGACKYHWGKLVRPVRARTDAMTGQGETVLSCCNDAVGQSSGCSEAPNHVFKTSSAAGLASVVQFVQTPENDRPDLPKAVCLDCEMGYTTRGMELIRFTATSWPTGKTVADVLVRPVGDILDLNSRFSGVWPRHIADALPYEPGNEVPEEDDDVEDKTPKYIMESPAAARALLFDSISPETPLLGHALENDVNALRMIHPCIVDSALLYPHKAGLPYRKGLKALMASELQRSIQTADVKTSGGADSGGHDSREDANAAGELIRHHIWQQWRTMKFGGWKFEGERLVPPVPAGPRKRAGNEGGRPVMGTGAAGRAGPRVVLRGHDELNGEKRAQIHRLENSHHQGSIGGDE